MAGVRDRNASAWLLPDDGTRTNHQLRAEMRRYADGDEVDLMPTGSATRQVRTTCTGPSRG